MYVIPRPILAECRSHPLVEPLYPTDIGWFPEARHHFRSRPGGAGQDHVMLCVGGHGRVVIDERENHLQTGHLLIIPRNRSHTYWAEDDNPWSIYWMHFLGDEASYYVERIPGAGHPVPVDGATQNEAVRLFRDCLDTIETGYTLPNLIYAAQSARHILSLLLFRNRAWPMEPMKERRQMHLAETLDYMRERISEQVRLEDLARNAGLSVSHFSEMFREETGQSPMAYFTHLRIRQACRLLDLTPKRIKAVAAEAGYTDPYYFSRAFKKVMGMSPGKYRAIKKG
jgi:AraC-like DNA-binding protein